MLPNDELYASQWHFSLIGDIARIWDDYTGAGVTAAIYDDGIQYDHPDLDDNYDTSRHFTHGGVTFDAYPHSLNRDAHGTSVAGLLAAEANGIGGVGVAFGAMLTGIDVFNDMNAQPRPVENASFAYGKNFDIMSNSWSYVPDFAAYNDLGDPGSDTALMLDAMRQATVDGRGGLGTVITMAAGNEGANASGYGGVGSALTIGVAASDETGWIARYSNWGPSILVTAPAAAYTTDLMGDDGYSPGDWTDSFSGTSAATPIVSGVVALMLEAAPDLGWRDVKTILALSAAQTGSAYGGAGGGEEQGAWQRIGEGHWNNGGASWHMSYGFGMVDAFAAVRMAEAWLTMTGAAQTSWNEVQLSASTLGTPTAIPDLGTGALSLTVTDAFTVEHVHVNIDLTHDAFSTLEADLIAPDGTTVALLLSPDGRQRALSPSISSFEFDIGVTAFLGQQATGVWTLQVHDLVPENAGVLQGFAIDFFGTADSDNDVHTFTSDFANLQAADGDRGVIVDHDDGIDWLNFAAFQQKVTVRLDLGYVIFDGVTQMTVDPDTVIENVMGGDGNDRLRGNVESNHLAGQRGNDDLRGLGGNDILEGGLGRDTAYAGSGEDWLDGGADRDRLIGGGGHDTIEGGDGKDILLGGRGCDHLIGGEGKDRLIGGLGNDTLDGGLSQDKLSGEQGADTFIFGVGSNIDLILDFEDDLDDILFDAQLWGGTVLSAAEMLGYADDGGADVVFTFGADVLIVIGIDDKTMLLDDIGYFLV